MGCVIPDIEDGGSGIGSISDINLAFSEQFIGDGVTTTFQLDGTIQNAIFESGSWDSLQIQVGLNSHAVNQQGLPIYRSSFMGVGVDRINILSITSTGLVTLTFPPKSGEDFDIWYWYRLKENDVIGEYVREDFVSSMEADATDLQIQIDKKSDIGHTHTASEITDFNIAVSANPDVFANTSSRHTHSNKSLLDTYTQTELDLADAVSKKHTAGTETQGGDISGTVGNATVDRIKNISVETPLNKGELLIFNGTDIVRLPTGIDGQVLTLNSTTTEGVEWDNPSSSGGALVYTNVISPPILGTSQDNYSPVGLEDSIRVHLTSNSNNIELTGIDSSLIQDGQVIIIVNNNTNGNRIRLRSNNSGSLPVNRFDFNQNITLEEAEYIQLIYLSSRQRWVAKVNI